MIGKLLIDLVLGIPTWVLHQVPALTLPPEITGTGSGTVIGGITSAGHAAASMNSWVPMSSAISALAFVFVCFALALVVRIVRIVASFLTAGGGSAA